MEDPPNAPTSKRLSRKGSEPRSVDRHRDLYAQILFTEGKAEGTLEIVGPPNTQQVAILKLAILLHLRKMKEFNALWQTASVNQDDETCELLAYRQRFDRKF